MAHGRRLQKFTGVAILLIAIATELASGQVDTCTGNGCSCSGSYDCCFQVRENAVRGTSVGSALLFPDFSSPTADSTFAIQDYVGTNENLGLFDIDSNGMITVDESADREDNRQGDCLRIVISFRQSPMVVSTPAFFAINIVDENDNPPTFDASEFNFTVNEAARSVLPCRGDIRTSLLASDIDAPNTANSAIHYRIADGMVGSDTFTVESATEPCITNIVNLDRETSPNYTCTLIAEDQGSDQLSSAVTVTFILLDVNDNAPEFINPPSELMIAENERVGYLIHQFEANDSDLGSNSEITFSINSATEPLPFSINATTGELSLISMLDHRAMSSYQVTICATDSGESVQMTGTAEVEITVLDRNDPIELSDLFHIEDIEENSYALINESIQIIFITVSEFDEAPNNVNNATLESGQEFFSISPVVSPSTSILFFVVIQTETIDREKNSTVDIVVRIDGGINPLFTEYINLTINVTDVNDNDPQLRETHFELVENANTGTLIGFLGDAAFDPDQGNNGTVGSYRLQSVISEDAIDLTVRFLSVNADGNLRPNGRLVAPTLDREHVGAFITCVVLLADMGQPNLTSNQSFTVQILDINDHCPDFQRQDYEFTLMENEDRFEYIGTVVAKDPDNGENGTVIYDIEEQGNFIIDQNGDIMSNRSFNREITAVYKITVTARDNGTQELPAKSPTTATTIVTIIIGDENDSPPMFTRIPETFSVDSSRNIGYLIFNFSTIVVDPDAPGPSNTVFFSLSPSDHFRIDPVSGKLNVIQSLQVTEVPFNLTVTAFNNVSNTMLQSSIPVSIIVVEAFPIAIVGASSGAAAFILILIVVVCMVIACLCCKNRRGKFVITEEQSLNNQTQKPILKSVPAEPAALIGDRRGRVKFSGKVEETHYDYEQAVGDSSVYRKQSITNFGSGSSDESPATPPRVHHNGNIPIEGINGDVPAHISHFNMHRPRQRSPLVYRTGLSTDVEIHEYSQGDDTNSVDGNSEDESTFSDDASNMNTSIPCFQGDDHGAELRYPPPLHSHMHQHEAAPPPRDLASLHHNVYHHAPYPSPHEAELTLTPQQNGSVSSPSHTPTHPPIPAHQMLPTLEAPQRRLQMHAGSRNYPHPLVMPDAYPRGTPDIPGYGAYVPSYQSDYDTCTSTYASTELDEALDFHVDAEPGFYSLTATDDQEDTQL